MIGPTQALEGGYCNESKVRTNSIKRAERLLLYTDAMLRSSTNGGSYSPCWTTCIDRIRVRLSLVNIHRSSV